MPKYTKCSSGYQAAAAMLSIPATASFPERKPVLVLSIFHLHEHMCVCVCVCVLVTQSCLTLCNPVDCSPLGFSVMGFSRQGYWSGLPFLSPGDLPDPGIEPGSPALKADSLLSEPPGEPSEPPCFPETLAHRCTWTGRKAGVADSQDARRLSHRLQDLWAFCPRAPARVCCFL